MLILILYSYEIDLISLLLEVGPLEHNILIISQNVLLKTKMYWTIQSDHI